MLRERFNLKRWLMRLWRLTSQGVILKVTIRLQITWSPLKFRASIFTEGLTWGRWESAGWGQFCQRCVDRTGRNQAEGSGNGWDDSWEGTEVKRLGKRWQVLRVRQGDKPETAWKGFSRVRYRHGASLEVSCNEGVGFNQNVRGAERRQCVRRVLQNIGLGTQRGWWDASSTTYMVWDARGHVSQPLHLSVSVSSMETGVASTSPVIRLSLSTWDQLGYDMVRTVPGSESLHNK